jgi:FixJ family two-component response regulator
VASDRRQQIGFDLGISERTTKIHRRQVLDKMEANSIADLVRMSDDVGIAPEGTTR